MIIDVLLGGLAVTVSLAVCIAIIKVLRDRPVETRGMVGLAVTVLHLVLSMALPALAWIAHNPTRPLAFVLSVLFFYWVSLIVLVVTIIRWLRVDKAPSAAMETRE